ncbi:MAG TPA: rhamnulokinase [Clostridiaceae bacterium]|nr:rhamnulokinase [Clostridiaceae bacterium]
MLKLLAFDYGASNGRAILGSFDGNKLKLEEVHRFPNDPVMANGTFYWDVLRLYHEMKQGILKCVKSGNGDIAGIGVDTWGVDFGLLGPSGELLGNPVHYRDSRTEGMIEEACKLVPKREIFERTGIAFQKFNSLYQLLAMKLNNSPILEKASTLLFMPDLLRYFLTGEKSTEFTIASTAQMLDAKNGGWDFTLLRKLGLPDNIYTDIINPGKVTGRLSKSVCEELGVSDIPVIAVAEHDTGSAVVSVPAEDEKYAYLSSGTWSLLGVELDKPIINDDTYNLNYTNEGGFNGTVRLLKNIMGLWIYQECRRAWEKKGETFTFDQLDHMISTAEPFVAFIDPDNDLFYSPGNMPDKIVEFCRKTGQRVPDSKAQILRCVIESLALKYRHAIEGLEKIIGYRIPVLHIVGGGCKNVNLSQFTANAIGRPVKAGPDEATSTGNLICQLVALGEVADLSQARAVVKESFPTVEYLPEDKERWEEAYDRFLKVANNPPN